MNSFLIKILQGLISTPQFAIKMKDSALASKTEHLIRTVNYIDRKRLNLFGKTIIDIGAKGGETPVYFAQLFPSHQVMGFEPSEAEFEKAKKKTAAYKNVSLYQVALGAGSMPLSGHSSKSPQPEQVIPIDTEKTEKEKTSSADEKKFECSSLDEIYSEMQPVLLLKTDTPGTELSILKGAVNTLALTRLVLVEMSNTSENESQGPYYEVDAFLRARGFILRDIFVSYRSDGEMHSFDALYENENHDTSISGKDEASR